MASMSDPLVMPKNIRNMLGGSIRKKFSAEANHEDVGDLGHGLECRGKSCLTRKRTISNHPHLHYATVF